MHCLTEKTQTDPREVCTALIARELSRYNIDIAALSGTRLAGEGALCERGADYAFFWSGCQPEVRWEAEVSFAIKSALVGKLVGPPKGINDRLISVRIPLSRGNHQDCNNRRGISLLSIAG